MMREYLGPQLSLDPLTTNAIDPAIATILKNHSCIIDPKGGETLLTYPEGTTRKESLLRVRYSRIYATLPDGIEVYERECIQGGIEISLVVPDTLDTTAFTLEERLILLRFRKESQENTLPY